MNNTNQNLHRFLLAAALALPLGAMADNPLDSPLDDAPGHGPRADDRRGPAMHGADGPRGDRGDGPGFGARFDGAPPYLHGIELSEGQQDKIFTILHGQIPYLREQGRARDKADRALFELHAAAKYDDAAAVKLAQAAAAADANITLSHLRTEQKVLAVLTAEQRKTLDERRNTRPPRPDLDRDGGPAGRPGHGPGKQ